MLCSARVVLTKNLRHGVSSASRSVQGRGLAAAKEVQIDLGDVFTTHSKSTAKAFLNT